MGVKIHLSKLLGERKMTMRQISVMTGIRPNTISNLYYETAKRIEVQHIAALCKALECDICDLFEFVDDGK